MNRTNIDWPGLAYSFNPITGCKRGCKYCYARGIWNRFYRKRYKAEFDKILFHNKRLLEPCKVKKPSTIFVGSMSDIEYWEKGHLYQVLNICNDASQHTYMFLSKNLRSYDGIKWPDNTMQGFTFTCLLPLTEYHQFIMCQLSELSRPCFSIEPICGTLKVDVSDNTEVVIVGAMTGNMKDKVIPEKDWIQSVRDHVPEEKIH